jgi:hypothetical protein
MFLKFLIKKDLLPALSLPVASIKIQTNRLNQGKNTLLNTKTKREKKAFQDTVFHFRCPTGIPMEFSPRHNLECLETLDRGHTLATCLKNILTGHAYSTQYRRVSAFKAFVDFLFLNKIQDVLDSVDAGYYEQTIYDYFYHRIDVNVNTLSTFNSNWDALLVVFSGFKKAGLFPDIQIPKNIKVGSADLSKLKRKSKLLSMSLKGVTRLDTKGAAVINAYTLASANDEEFLNAVESDERYVFNEIQSAAIKEVRIHYRKFKAGQLLIANCNINEILDTYEKTGEMVDRRYSGSGQVNPISFFSQNHPNGLSNLLALFWHKNQGFMNRKAFPGAHRIYEFGAENIQNMLGLNTKNSLPFFLVILAETGFNVEGLEKAEIEDSHGKRSILCKSASGETVRVEVKKPRARRVISKLIKTSGFRLQRRSLTI